MYFVPFITHAVTLFSDGFESDTEFFGWSQDVLTEWDVIDNASGAFSGSKRAQVNGTTTGQTYAIIREQSTSGYENISLSFWYKINNSLESGDHVLVEWSLDGSSWTTVEDITNASTTSGYKQSILNISSGANNQSGFRFRFFANLGASSDVVSIDDVELSGGASVSVPSSPAEESTPVRRSRPGRSRSTSTSNGQVLGISTSVEREIAIKNAEAEFIDIMRKFIVLLQSEIASYPTSHV
ncbi:MAG: choice-of-anchor J domain-containing protein [Patescibacteria group bacterium]